MTNNLSIAERNKIVVENMHIVRIIARQYYIHSYLREDLEQEGYLGLIVAAEHYNQEQGVRFDSYAGWWVRRYIEDAIHRYGHVVKLPREESIEGDWQTVYMVEDLLSNMDDRNHEQERHEWQEEVLGKIELAINTLTKREQIIVRYMYGIGIKKRNSVWIASQLGMSHETIKKIGMRALKKIEKKLR